jgi:hypothetical protein
MQFIREVVLHEFEIFHELLLIIHAKATKKKNPNYMFPKGSPRIDVFDN